MKINGSRIIILKWVSAYIQDNIDQYYSSFERTNIVIKIKENCKSKNVPLEYIKQKLCDHLMEVVSLNLEHLNRRKKLKFVKLLYRKMKHDILYDLRNVFINNEIEALLSYFTPASELSGFLELKK